MLPVCLLFFSLFTLAKSISLPNCHALSTLNFEIFGKRNVVDINKWVEDKDPRSTGNLTYISNPKEGITLSGQLNPSATDAFYGQRYLKAGLLAGIANATGLSLLIDPLTSTKTIQSFNLELVTDKSERYAAKVNVKVDTIEFKRYPFRVDIPYESFKPFKPLSKHLALFKPTHVNELAIYVRGPVSEDKTTFYFMIKEISVDANCIPSENIPIR